VNMPDPTIDMAATGDAPFAIAAATLKARE
jgi:hypothetical protein